MAELFKTSGVYRSVWAIKCEGCGTTVKMGPGSKASMERLIALVGPFCNSCLAAATPMEEKN